MDPTVMSFGVACKIFFGMKEGQSLMEFRNELKELTEEDRKEIIAQFEMNGVKIKE